jgi:L-ascorbate metabolism protein UlaG (beta-lactamase superfamily)
MAPGALTWLGHATTLVEVGGARVLTDPVLRGRIAHLRRHAPAPAAPRALDAILVSHLHRDHLDLPSLRALDPAVPVIVPRGAAPVLGRARRRDVREVDVGDAVEIVDGLGYIVEAGGQRVYFAGDTALFAGMADLPALDAALLPVWGYGPTMGPGHMDPEQAAEALTLLRPRLAVPIHWGTFLPLGLRARHGHVLETPGPSFAARAAELAPEVRVVVSAPGERVDFD